MSATREDSAVWFHESNRLFLKCLSLLFFIFLPLLASAKQGGTILVLQSYHSGMRWTSNVEQGIQQQLEKHGGHIRLFMEYMDTKHVPFDAEYERFYTELLQRKYGERVPDVILSVDNNAFEFLKRHGNRLFPDVPVVFCGVNFFKDECLDGFDNFTGVVEAFDIHATLKAALDIHPDTKYIYVISDHLPSSRLATEESKQQLADLAIDVPIEFAGNLPISGIEHRLQKLPEHSLVILGAFFRDADGIYYLPTDSLSRFRQAAPKTPIYGQLDTHIGLGIIGGYLIDGKAQGRYAMDMALQILDGKPVSDIPVRKRHTNSYIFDWTEMDRFGISASRLPLGSAVINKPFSIWELYHWEIIGIAILLTAQALSISRLLLVSRQRRKAMRELDQERMLLEKRVGERTEELWRANRKLEKLSIYDALTGLANRRRFNEQLEIEFKQMQRNSEPLSMIMLDIDYFKDYNDQYGHVAGDECLQMVSALLQERVGRPSDLVARYGGEEFAIILPDTDTAGAQMIVKSIFSGLVERDIHHEASRVANHVTLSAGVITVDSGAVGSPIEVVMLADQLLYRAKAEGRNRMVARKLSSAMGRNQLSR